MAFLVEALRRREGGRQGKRERAFAILNLLEKWHQVVFDVSPPITHAVVCLL